MFPDTHCVPRLIDDVLPGLLCFVFVPAHHVDGPTWEEKHEALIFYQCELRDTYQGINTFLGYSHGCGSADSTVGPGDHERPSHDGHAQVLGLKVFRCRLISVPKGKQETKPLNRAR